MSDTPEGGETRETKEKEKTGMEEGGRRDGKKEVVDNRIRQKEREEIKQTKREREENN